MCIRDSVEFVSANPTGPLHVGHGRHAAYGATVANLLQAVGYRVTREYYINDAGRQMEILAASTWLRYLEICGESFTFPANGYRGDYILAIAGQLHAAEGDALRRSAAQVFEALPADEPQGGDKDAYIDALIVRARRLIGDDAFRRVLDHAVGGILTDIREDLEEFGVTFDSWYSERSLSDSGAIEELSLIHISKNTMPPTSNTRAFGIRHAISPSGERSARTCPSSWAPPLPRWRPWKTWRRRAIRSCSCRSGRAPPARPTWPWWIYANMAANRDCRSRPCRRSSSI